MVVGIVFGIGIGKVVGVVIGIVVGIVGSLEGPKAGKVPLARAWPGAALGFPRAAPLCGRWRLRANAEPRAHLGRWPLSGLRGLLCWSQAARVREVPVGMLRASECCAPT